MGIFDVGFSILDWPECGVVIWTHLSSKLQLRLGVRKQSFQDSLRSQAGAWERDSSAGRAWPLIENPAIENQKLPVPVHDPPRNRLGELLAVGG
jgi:hypothetical protein